MSSLKKKKGKEVRVLEGAMLAGRDKGAVLALLGFLCGEERLWQWAEWPGGGWSPSQMQR